MTGGMGAVFYSPHFMHNIGSLISEYRRKNKLSQKYLAGLIRTNATYLSAIENGSRKPTFAFIERAAAALGVPVEVILWDSIDIGNIPQEDRRTIDLAKTLVKHYLRANPPRPPQPPLNPKD